MQQRLNDTVAPAMNPELECIHPGASSDQALKATSESDSDHVSRFIRSFAKSSFREKEERTMDVFVRGPLNDEAQLPRFPHRKIELISIDWSGVSYIGSAGIVSWLHWLKLVLEQKPSIRLEYKGCPISLIQAFQLVRELKPKNATLTSLQIPYRIGDLECTRVVSIANASGKLTSRQLLMHIEREITARAESLCEVEEIEIDLTESDLAFLTA